MGKKAPKAPSAQQLAAGALINQITPFGTTQFGTIDPETGQLTALPGAITQVTQETPFQEAFRGGREAIALGLLGEIGGVSPTGGGKGGGQGGVFPGVTGPREGGGKGGALPTALTQAGPQPQIDPTTGGLLPQPTQQTLSPAGLPIDMQNAFRSIQSQFGDETAQAFLKAQGASPIATTPAPTPTGQPTAGTPLQVATGGGEGGLLGARARIAGQRGERGTIRDILPSARAAGEGLPDFLGVSDVEGRLTQPFVTDFAGEGARLEQATFQRTADLLAPRFEEQDEALNQELANRGIPIGSAAFEREKNRLQEQQSRLLQDTAFGAVAAGRQEQERLARLGLATRGQQLGEGLSLAGLAAGQRGQLFGERQGVLGQALQKQLALANLEGAQRAQRFGEIGSLFGLPGTGFQSVPVPQLGTNPAAQSAALQQQAAQQRNAGKGGFGQLLGTLGGAFIGGPQGAALGGGLFR